ncbi:BsaA family SipW-dependent biofilm matrix protein [Candidatus Saccharibacteria bacterium]|nr:BsaA family SipW-dependent biofilm matrix protein [Candidatus Saccharibacteria bacterium]
MKRFKNLSLKKRTLAIAGVSVLCLVVVGTIAFNQDSIFFNNLFKLADDNVEFVETFDSPDDWQPCQETPKTAIARNKNSTPRYVRMKINEYWREKNSQTPASDHETSDLPLTWDDSGTTKNYAVINTQNDDKWELKRDGWYYYKTALSQDEETLSLLKSVTFNCEVNTAGEIRYSADGKAGESVPTEYADATYHLYITFQMSDEEYPEPRHVVDCDNATELYDIIACQTLGPDDNTTFGTSATFDDNRIGVSTYASTKDDEYPVYYYRSGINTNYVDFADKCWQILRTTSTGGVKLMYSGDMATVQVGENEYSRMCFSGEELKSKFNTNYQDMHQGSMNLNYAGYMYGDHENAVPHEDGNYMYETFYTSTGDRNNPEMWFANDVSWDGEKYHLVGEKKVLKFWQGNYNNPPEDSYLDVMTGYRYTCRGPVDECEYVDYMVSVTSGTDVSYAVSLYNGDDIEDYKSHIHENLHDSTIKTVVDGWYRTNLSSHSNMIEDTVYCADRDIRGGGMSGKDFIQENVGPSDPYGAYRAFSGSFMRNYYNHASVVNNAKPSLDCRKEDSYTVSSTIGNGALTYPVGLPSADEIILTYNNKWSSISGSTFWTGSFAMASSGNGPNVWNFSSYRDSRGEGSLEYSSLSSEYTVMPVISLKPGAKVISGNGNSWNAPYRIEE